MSKRGYFYGSGTFAERSAKMVRALTVDSVSNSDQCMILAEQDSRDFDGVNPRARMPYRMTVAHISDSGWVDIFIGEIDTSGDGAGDTSRHVALTPSEFNTLQDAWNRHPATIARRESGK